MKESCRLVCGHIARQTSQGHVERTTVTRTSLELVEVWTRDLEVTGKFEVTEATGMGGITCGREKERKLPRERCSPSTRKKQFHHQRRDVRP